MKVKNKVVYVLFVYEEIQYEVTSVDENNVPLRSSFHIDVSLLQRIESLRYDVQIFELFKAFLQPMIDNLNFCSQFEDVFGEFEIKVIGIGDLFAGCKFTAKIYGMIIGIYCVIS